MLSVVCLLLQGTYMYLSGFETVSEDETAVCQQ